MLGSQSCGQPARMVKANRSGHGKVELGSGTADSEWMEKGWQCQERWETGYMD